MMQAMSVEVGDLTQRSVALRWGCFACSSVGVKERLKSGVIESVCGA